MKLTLNSVFALAFVFTWTTTIQAQGRAPGAGGLRPAVSPYLNLLNSGDPAINYFGIVRPQIAFRGAIKNLEGEVDSLDKRDSLSQTGHPSSFMTQSRFFMTNGGASSPSSSNQSNFGGAPKRR